MQLCTKAVAKHSDSPQQFTVQATDDCYVAMISALKSRITLLSYAMTGSPELQPP
jgi:hypothetical protein